MALQTYFPTSEADRIVWLTNYRAKIVTHGETLGLTPADIAETQADITYYLWLLQYWHPAVQQFAQAATALKNQAGTGTGDLTFPPFPTTADMPPVRPAGILTRLFAQITRAKTHSAFNDSIGRDLGVIATGTGTDHPYPDLAANAEIRLNRLPI